MSWFPANSGLWDVVLACYQAIVKGFLTVLLDFLCKLDASILFVRAFVEFVYFFFRVQQ